MADGERPASVFDEETLKTIQLGGIDTAHSKASSQISFVDLPAELRNRTYCYVFARTGGFRHPRMAYNLKKYVYRDRRRRYRNMSEVQHTLAQPALTQTCKRIRSETLPIFYSKIRFYGVLDPRERSIYREVSQITAGWLRAIGPENRSLLIGIIIRVIEHPSRHLQVLGSIGLSPSRGEQLNKEALRAVWSTNTGEGRIAKKHEPVVDWQEFLRPSIELRMVR